MSELLQGNELRRAVANALGWRVEKKGNRWRICDHLGNNYGWNYRVDFYQQVVNGEATIDSVWHDLVRSDILPNYDKDMNTITAMPLPLGYAIEMWRESGEWVVRIHKGAFEFISRHAILPTAAWNAWLSMGIKRSNKQ